jgi:hypothetical protein
LFSVLFLGDISIKICFIYFSFLCEFWFQYSITESLHTDSDAQFYVQHLIRKLGSEAYIGQRAILSVSERISVLAESLLFLDPFDDSFPSTHECMFKL